MFLLFLFKDSFSAAIILPDAGSLRDILFSCLQNGLMDISFRDTARNSLQKAGGGDGGGGEGQVTGQRWCVQQILAVHGHLAASALRSQTWHGKSPLLSFTQTSLL